MDCTRLHHHDLRRIFTPNLPRFSTPSTKEFVLINTPESSLDSSSPEFLGWPLFLVSCGLHFRACRVILMAGVRRVCPIKLYFLLRFCRSGGSWFVLFHRSTLLTLSLHLLFSVLMRHIFMKVCRLSVAPFVVLHVSDPLDITTLEFKMHVVVLMRCILSFRSSWAGQTLFHCHFMVNNEIFFCPDSHLRYHPYSDVQHGPWDSGPLCRGDPS